MRKIKWLFLWTISLICYKLRIYPKSLVINNFITKFEICDLFGIPKRIVNTDDDIKSLYGLLSSLKDDSINVVEVVKEVRED